MTSKKKDLLPAPQAQEESQPVVKRDKKGKFVTGTAPANPLGRKPKEKPISKHLVELLNEINTATGKTNAEEIAEAMVKVAMQSNHPAFTATIKHILERVEGKVKEEIDIDKREITLKYVLVNR